MAFADHVGNIRTSTYGWEVRESIASALEECYTDVHDVTVNVEQLVTDVRNVSDRASANSSAISATSSELHSALKMAQSEFESSINVTASYLRSEFYNANNDTRSILVQTADSIRSSLYASNSSLYSSIQQTATNIRSEVAASNSRLYSTIEQTASYIRSEVGNAESGIYSRINQTAESITMEIASSDSNMSSLFEQTVDGFRTTVTDLKNGLISTISQTASQIRSEVHTTDSRLYSFIEQTATNIRHEVADVEAGLQSSIEQTASQIRSEVHTTDSRLYSFIEQTATNIRHEVADVEAGLQSSIEQTASSIRSEVHTTDSRLYSFIEQTATSIRQEVGNTASQLRSRITQESNRISLVVEGTGDNAKIKPASIVAAINDQGQSEVKISGDRIDIDASQVKIGSTSNVSAWMTATGQDIDSLEGLVADCATIAQLNVQKARIDTINSNYITANNINAKLANLSWLQVNSIQTTSSTGQSNFSSYYGNHYYFNIPGGGGSVTYRDVKDGVFDLSISLSGNTYTLKKKNYAGTESDVGTFSRAITGWQDVWDSNGNLSVKATPQNQSHTVNQSLIMQGTSQYTTCDVSLGYYDSSSAFHAQKRKYACLYLTSTGSSATVEIREDSTSGTTRASIGVGDVWSAGRSAGKESVGLNDPVANAKPYGLDQYRTFTVSTNGRSPNLSKDIGLELYEGGWSGNSNTVYMKYGNTDYARYSVDASSIATSNYNSGVSAGKSSVGLNDPVANAKPYGLDQYRTFTVSTNGRSPNLSKDIGLELYEGGWSGNSNTVYMKYGNTDYARYSVDASSIATSNYNSGVSAGKSSVGLNDPVANAKPYGLDQYRTFTVSTNGRSPNLSKDIGLELYEGGWSGNSNTVYMKYGNTDYARYSVDASSIATSNYNSGYYNGTYYGKSTVGLDDPVADAKTGGLDAYRTFTVRTNGRTNSSGTTENLEKSISLQLVPSGKSVSLHYGSSSYATVDVSDSNLLAKNIKSGVTIFGVTGTYGYSKSVSLYCKSKTGQSSGYYLYTFTVEDRSSSKFSTGTSYTFHYN